MGSREDLRRTLGWALVGGLSIAALTAIVAIASGSFDETDWRVIGTSLGFSVWSAAGAAGANLRFRSHDSLRLLGAATAVLCGLAFVFLAAAIWTLDGNGSDEELWRGFGITGVLGLAGSHACLMLGALRETDTDAVRFLTTAAVVLAAFESLLALLPISGLVEDVDEGMAQFLAVLLVLMVLATALAPIVRKLQRQAPESASPGVASRSAPGPSAALADEVMAVANRIEELNADPGSQGLAIRRECERLRELARSFR